MDNVYNFVIRAKEEGIEREAHKEAVDAVTRVNEEARPLRQALFTHKTSKSAQKAVGYINAFR